MNIWCRWTHCSQWKSHFAPFFIVIYKKALDWCYVIKFGFSSSFSKLLQHWLGYFQLFNISVTMQ